MVNYKTIIVDDETHQRLKFKSIMSKKPITTLVKEFVEIGVYEPIKPDIMHTKKDDIKNKNWWRI